MRMITFGLRMSLVPKPPRQYTGWLTHALPLSRTIFHWCLPFDDERLNRLSRELTETLEAYVRGMSNKPAMPEQHGAVSQAVFGPIQSPRTRRFPYFMNEAMADQPLMQSYGHWSLGRLRAVKQDVDASGDWSRRTVGWRV